MNKKYVIGFSVIALIIIVGVFIAGSRQTENVALTSSGEGSWEDKAKDQAMMKNEQMKASTSTSAESVGAGKYEVYAAEKLAFAKTGKVVLFFKANWCPTCRALDRDITSHLDQIPKDVLILDVDYDNSRDLKVKYGVMVQHTLVQVDENGNLISKWHGSAQLGDILKNIK